jgi:hypothetical protein
VSHNIEFSCAAASACPQATIRMKLAQTRRNSRRQLQRLVVRHLFQICRKPHLPIHWWFRLRLANGVLCFAGASPCTGVTQARSQFALHDKQSVVFISSCFRGAAPCELRHCAARKPFSTCAARARSPTRAHLAMAYSHYDVQHRVQLRRRITPALYVLRTDLALSRQNPRRQLQRLVMFILISVIPY